MLKNKASSSHRPLVSIYNSLQSCNYIYQVVIYIQLLQAN